MEKNKKIHDFFNIGSNSKSLKNSSKNENILESKDKIILEYMNEEESKENKFNENYQIL